MFVSKCLSLSPRIIKNQTVLDQGRISYKNQGVSLKLVLPLLSPNNIIVFNIRFSSRKQNIALIHRDCCINMEKRSYQGYVNFKGRMSTYDSTLHNCTVVI